MDDVCTYEIMIRGQIDEGDINAASPLRLRVARSGEDCTLVTFRADQSGMIGLIRHLHSLGFVLLSIQRLLS
jgi:hypothetical protein